MICPRCKTAMEMSIIHDIEIDHCPACKGVWLDRGELDKIIEQTNSFDSHGLGRSEYRGHQDDHGNHFNQHDDGHHAGHHRYSHDNGQGIYGNQTPHRRSFLSDLFDF